MNQNEPPIGHNPGFKNHKSYRAKIFKGKPYHGYVASKKQVFFGIKVHMIIDENRVPVEFAFTPGCVSDIQALRNFTLDLPKGAILLGDRAYTDYAFEESLLEFDEIKLISKRRKNLKRQHRKEEEYILSRQRNIIETTFSSIVSRMPKTIRAATEKGFFLKVFFFIIAYMVGLYHPLG